MISAMPDNLIIVSKKRVQVFYDRSRFNLGVVYVPPLAPATNCPGAYINRRILIVLRPLQVTAIIATGNRALFYPRAVVKKDLLDIPELRYDLCPHEPDICTEFAGFHFHVY